MDHNLSNKLVLRTEPLITSGNWDGMEELIDYLISSQQKKLQVADSMEAVKEAQGQIRAYNTLKSLPKTIRDLKQASRN